MAATATTDTGPGTEEITFDLWFRELLRLEGISQEDAARRLGVALQTVSRWVRGVHEPRLGEIRKIYRTFGTAPPLDPRDPSDSRMNRKAGTQAA